MLKLFLKLFSEVILRIIIIHSVLINVIIKNQTCLPDWDVESDKERPRTSIPAGQHYYDSHDDHDDDNHDHHKDRCDFS